MWQWTIHHAFHQSPVQLLVGIIRITCTQPTMLRTLNTCNATGACVFLTYTNFETGSNVPKLSGIVVRLGADQPTMKAPSLFGSLILISYCSYHQWRLFSAPWHLPTHRFHHNQSVCWGIQRQLRLRVHCNIGEMHSPSKYSTLTLITCQSLSSTPCCCSSDKYVFLWLLCMITSWMLVHNAMRLVLTMGPGNPRTVQVWTGETVQFSSKTVQKPDPLLLGGPNLDSYPLTHRFCQFCLDRSVPISGSSFWDFYIWSHLDILLLIAKDRYLYIVVMFELIGSL